MAVGCGAYVLGLALHAVVCVCESLDGVGCIRMVALAPARSTVPTTNYMQTLPFDSASRHEVGHINLGQTLTGREA